MSFDSDIVAGFAVLLAADVDASWAVTWRPTGAYQAGETPIFDSAVPPTPDRIITLTTYGLGDHPVLSDSDIGLQVRTRSEGADPRDVKDLDDAIADALLGRFPMTLSTDIRVQTLVRASWAPLGQDGNQRWNRVSNYNLGLYRPGPHRL